jgi:hypothetical protein
MNESALRELLAIQEKYYLALVDAGQNYNMGMRQLLESRLALSPTTGGTSGPTP